MSAVFADTEVRVGVVVSDSHSGFENGNTSPLLYGVVEIQVLPVHPPVLKVGGDGHYWSRDVTT